MTEQSPTHEGDEPPASILGLVIGPWTEKAACAGCPPEWWNRKNTFALEICASCPVKQKCLDHALETPEQHGIWGGMTAEERKRHRRGITPNRLISCTADQCGFPTFAKHRCQYHYASHRKATRKEQAS
jgi:hypothetical protein